MKNFLYASKGIAYAWRTERNFRLEVILGAVAVAVALFLRADVVPILLCCALVLSLELINTALEAVVDLVSPTYHPLARITKDVAAGAVLMASALSAVVGATVLLPALWRQFG
jgi:diacylglycerol kinase (ATP)